MLCRPHGVVRLLSRARAGARPISPTDDFYLNYLGPTLLPRPCITTSWRAGRFLSYCTTNPQLENHLIAPAEFHEPFFPPGDRGQDDFEDQDDDLTKQIDVLASRETKLRQAPHDLIRRAKEIELHLPKALSHPDFDFARLYSDPVIFARFSVVRHHWSLYRRILWLEESTKLAAPLLEVYRKESTRFEKRWHNEPLPLPPECTIHPPSILIGAMAQSARMLLDVLDILLRRASVPFHIEVDCLRYLARFRRNELNADGELMDRFSLRLQTLRDPTTWPARLRPSHMDFLLKGFTRQEATALLEQFLLRSREGFRAGRDMLLDSYISLGDVGGALRTLETYSTKELESPSEGLSHRIVNLLHAETVTSSTGVGDFAVLPELLKLGVQPNQAIHNMAIQNAVKHDLSPLAWDLVQYAQEQSIEVDDKSHLFLLKDSFIKRDLPKLNQLMTTIHTSVGTWQNPYIIIYIFNIIREICLYQRKSSPAEALSHLLTVYDRAYNRSALIKLNILYDSEDLASTKTLPDPPALVLAYMMWTWVLVQKRDRIVLNVWNRFRELLVQGDAVFVSAAGEPSSFNGFLLFFFRKPRTLRYAMSILRVMLKTQYCQHDEITSAICIIAYLKCAEQQHEVTEEIRRILKEHNMRIDADRWQKYVQVRFPEHGLDSENAKLFVKEDPVYDEAHAWPSFDWDATVNKFRYRQEPGGKVGARMDSNGNDAVP